MRVKAIKSYFLKTSNDLVTIPKDLYKIHVKTAKNFAVEKSNEVTSVEEKCNKLLIIRYRILNVTVPLQLLHSYNVTIY